MKLFLVQLLLRLQLAMGRFFLRLADLLLGETLYQDLAAADNVLDLFKVLTESYSRLAAEALVLREENCRHVETIRRLFRGRQDARVERQFWKERAEDLEAQLREITELGMLEPGMLEPADSQRDTLVPESGVVEVLGSEESLERLGKGAA